MSVSGSAVPVDELTQHLTAKQNGMPYLLCHLLEFKLQKLGIEVHRYFCCAVRYCVATRKDIIRPRGLSSRHHQILTHIELDVIVIDMTTSITHSGAFQQPCFGSLHVSPFLTFIASEDISAPLSLQTEHP